MGGEILRLDLAARIAAIDPRTTDLPVQAGRR